MAIKNLLIAYNGTQAADVALALALKMAEKYDAWLTGLLAFDASPFVDHMRGWVPSNIEDAVLEVQRHHLDHIAARFESRRQASGRQDKVELLRVEGPPDETIVEYARYVDLTLIGQFDEQVETRGLVIHPNLIALQSGRPVLVVPRDLPDGPLNEHAVLAWDGKRAAARALADAMQILETKMLVSIVTVGAPPPAPPAPGLDVAVHLARHGVRTEWVRLEPARGSIAAAIFAFCAERGAGLLVMGAYEHSKFREDYFGGVTHDALRESRIPVLLSH